MSRWLIFVAILLMGCAKESDLIVLGQSCALSGPSKELGIGVANGANAWFNYINENGGIDGKKIKLITLDDSYEPKIAKLNAKKLIENERVFALFGFVGTPTTYEVLPLSKNTPFVAPITGADFLYSKYSDLVVVLRKSYADELDLLMRRFRSDGIKRISVFYQNDTFGKTTLENARKKAEEFDIEIVSEGSYTRNTLSIAHAIFEIVPTKPDAVVMIDAYKPASYFIKEARKQGLTSTIFAHLSFVNSDSLQKELKDLTNVEVVQVVGTPDDPEFVAVMERYYAKSDISYASYEGFLSAKAVTETLKETRNKKEFVKLLKSRRFNTLAISKDKNGSFVNE